MVVFDHEVVSEGTDDRSDVRHDPRDPEEVVCRAERLLAEPGNEREEPAVKTIKNWAVFIWGIPFRSVEIPALGTDPESQLHIFGRSDWIQI